MAPVNSDVFREEELEGRTSDLVSVDGFAFSNLDSATLMETRSVCMCVRERVCVGGAGGGRVVPVLYGDKRGRQPSPLVAGGREK